MPPGAKRARTITARRRDLIAGTIRSIAALGYNNSTVQTISEAAGLSRGLIGHYFRGKDELLIEAFHHLCTRADEETREAVRAAGDDPLQRLLAATAATFESAASRDISLVWLACCGVAPWNSHMTELHNGLYRRYREWIQRMMEGAAEERGVEFDAKRAALTYVQMVDGFWMGWLMDKDAYSLHEATAIVCDWVLGLFGERTPVNGRAAGSGAGGTPVARGPARRRRAGASHDNRAEAKRPRK